MLESVKHILADQKIVLADTSPSRRQVLRELGIKFDVAMSHYVSKRSASEFPTMASYVTYIAENKARSVFEKMKDKEIEPDFVIGAHTVTVLNRRFCKEATDEKMASFYLNRLNGRVHSVYTGVAIVTPNVVEKYSERCSVALKSLSKSEIKSYIKSGEGMNKVGGIAYDGLGLTFINHIEGEYSTLRGLPSRNLCRYISKMCLLRSELLSLSRKIGPETAFAVLQPKATTLRIEPPVLTIKKFLYRTSKADKGEKKTEETAAKPMTIAKARVLTILRQPKLPSPSVLATVVGPDIPAVVDNSEAGSRRMSLVEKREESGGCRACRSGRPRSSD